MANSLVAEMLLSDAAQFTINQRQQGIQSNFVAAGVFVY
jgi:hypothetical protein